jgi:hypothetical protein
MRFEFFLEQMVSDANCYAVEVSDTTMLLKNLKFVT